ncbi:GH12 family glycosyl hydrolase domain-containing protein [Actinoplanes teichomyceticus]|uniref:Cellulose binding domain-containing protein n=1 Tax=Actinoplanes teichomyceticus TaxID=1867 RepID=A0A561WSF7_ACTTI|nr:cellulose binding domain-containing protein [Actinoplanes teichomyceticus]TWG26810.1 cellulose binding domain-containing protein [Actinoplanes teichomyceticus]GIF15209.1 glycosyl hydrolase family 5 [Actinoplanes teichomyceticus]
MRRTLRSLTVAAAVVLTALTTLVVTQPAQADTRICEQYGATTIGGRYVVMNNRWGGTAEQCINVTGTGFAITSQQSVGNTSGAPVSYPAVYYGCHYTRCSPGTNLPLRVSSITSATSSINWTYVSGATYDAAYDIWLDPTPRTDGVNAQEIMIWFNRQGSIQPIGSVVGNATIGGRTWQVWRGSNGSNAVISYVAPSPITSWSFSVLDFINDVKSRGAITDSWYLTSLQAGFEPWIGGAGLAVNNFSAAVNGGGTGTPPTSPSTPAPGTGCRVSYATNVWSSGFTANITVANTGTAPIDGWTLGFALPSGQSVTSVWGATLSGTSGAVTARNVSYNGSIPAGGSTTFGFQGAYSGSFTAPSAFTLNGSACTRA